VIGTWLRADGERGSFLAVLRRGPDGAYEPLLETLVPFPT
jgi:hypothetical protein